MHIFLNYCSLSINFSQNYCVIKKKVVSLRVLMKSRKNSKKPISGNRCSNCGQSTKPTRINGRYIIREIVDVLSADRGILYTIKRILLSPGKSIRHYITEDRSRYVKPITFVIITSLIYAVINYFFGVKDNTFTSPFIQINAENSPIIENMVDLLQRNFAYSNMLIGLFTAFWLRLLFRKYGYNLFEIFVLLCFLLGVSTLFFSIGIIFENVTDLNVIRISNSISGIYLIWASGQFFDKKKVASYIKTFCSYILGGATFGALTILFGFLIERII